MSDLEDNLFKTPLSSAGGFRFDEKVALVFPDMIRRSVPGYGHIIGSSGLIAKRYAKANTVIYDLGCSLGATTLAIAGEVETPGCRIIAVDNSEAMLAQARMRLSEPPIDTLPIDWVCEDISDMTFERCSVVALNFTLQFIEKGKREKLLSDVRRALYPNGALILAEKLSKKMQNHRIPLTRYIWISNEPTATRSLKSLGNAKRSKTCLFLRQLTLT